MKLQELADQWRSAPLWQRLFVVVVIPGAVAWVLWFYVISPNEQRIQDLEARKQELNLQITKYSRYLKGSVIKKLQEEKQELEQEIERKKRMMGTLHLSMEHMPVILDKLHKITARHNLIVSSVSIHEPKKRLYLLKDGVLIAKEKLADEMNKGNKNKAKRDRSKDKGGEEEYKSVSLIEVLVEFSVSGKGDDILQAVKDIYKLSGGFVFEPKLFKYRVDSGGDADGEIGIKILFKSDSPDSV